MTLYLRLILTCLFSVLLTVAQSQARNLPAVKTTLPIKIDGNLDDAAWKSVASTGNFIVSSPRFGDTASERTEVKVLYDNTAIYVGAYLYGNPKNIRKQVTARDVIGMQDVDYFLVGFDTYHDRQNAYVFRVTAAGVQGDIRESQTGSNNGGVVNDASWDAVWESRASIKSDGWVVEMKIPFSAIRFSKKEVQDWGINFARFIRKKNENSIWDPENPNISGDINQWGNWIGLKDISPPLRLSLLPYLSGGFRISPTNKGRVTEFLKSGGMDVKFGINESFTLDMTLVPDFAQVQSDNVFLNLSPFQVKFDDQRPFFTEGTELFNKAGLFYSRRIGATPAGSADVLANYGDTPDYKILKNPGITRLYNATKFSGRTRRNLGIGIFNAISAAMYAKIENLTNGKDSAILTDPLTNYNIIVLDQALKNRSSICFTNTNVLRKGNSRNANVSSIDISMFDRRNKHNFTLAGKYSSIWGTMANYNGFNAITTFGKVSGLVQYNGSIGVKTDTYDPNDLGFIVNNNAFNYSGALSYNILHPTRYFLMNIYKINFNNSYLYKPFNWTSLQVNASAFFLFKNYWDVTIAFNSSPIWTNDYFVNSSKYNGYFLKRTPYYYLSFNGSTDSRKKLYFGWSVGGAESPLPNDPYWQTNLELRYRINDKFQLTGSYAIEQDKGNWGWAFLNNPDGSPIIARRDVKRNTAVISAQYNFTSKINWNVRVRHYWSLLSNTNFYNVKPDGYWNEVAFIPGQNLNFNTFNLDMFFTWDFLLGSRLTIAWKNALGSNVNIDPYSNTRYLKNFDKVFNNPHSNELTVKLVYYLDYLSLKRKK
jgi:hypothetical protein